MAKEILLAPGAYDVYDTVAETTTEYTVTAVVAGTISNVSPTVGDTLTVTGSTAGDALVSYNWQRDGVDLDPAVTTATAVASAAGDWRRGISRGGAPTLYTPAVTVTAAAASGPTFTRVASGSTEVTTNAGNSGPLYSGVNLAAVPEGDELVIAVHRQKLASGTVTAPTLNSVAATAIASAVIGDGASGASLQLYRATMPADTTPDLQLGVVSGGSTTAWAYYIYHVAGRTSDTAVGTDAGVTSEDMEIALSAAADGAALAFAAFPDGNSDMASITFTTGVTKDGAEERPNTKHGSAAAKAEGLSAGTLTVTVPRPAGANAAGVAVVLTVE